MPIRARRTATEAWAGVRPCTATAPAKGTATAPLRSTIKGGRVWFPLSLLRFEPPPKRPPLGSKMLTARVSPIPMISVGASLDASASVLKERGGAAFNCSLSAKSRFTRA
ncbi:hypothetical protein D3C86_1813750 [compost metagenome]